MTTEIGSKGYLDILFNILNICIFEGDISIFSEKRWNFEILIAGLILGDKSSLWSQKIEKIREIFLQLTDCYYIKKWPSNLHQKCPDFSKCKVTPGSIYYLCCTLGTG